MVFERVRTFAWVPFAVVLLAGCPALAGSLNLGPEQIVQAGGSDLTVNGYSVPDYVDWNSDGRMDLIVGEGSGNDDGKIRVYLNGGTSAAPSFSDFSYVQVNGADLVTPGCGCIGTFPRVVSDWNGDGRKDLLVGLANGDANVYFNIGTNSAPTFNGGRFMWVGQVGSRVPINVGQRTSIALADWDNDGARDMLLGALDGKVRLYINEGTTAVPAFHVEAFVQAGGVDLVVPGERSSPVVTDADGDGRKDLLVGNTDGQLLLYSNRGTDAAPLFDTYTYITADGVAIDLPGSARSRPFVADWTGDGFSDVLIGAADGKVHLYQGIPEPASLLSIAMGVPFLLKRPRR